LKDAETEGHSKRVTAFTIAIARAMGLPRDQIAMIARGAFLHDIGKMAIPDAILRKPGKLDPDEVTIMREHAYRGYQMLKKIPFLAEAAEIVYSHQEKYDGTGYPRGLKGKEIPLGARLFSVADTLDAMTSDRPYRAAQTLTAARKEIELFSGRQFDPEVVKMFLSMPENIWPDLRKEIDAQIFRFAYSTAKSSS
jgi:putative nucleotidyltransferase with HDIG domain